MEAPPRGPSRLPARDAAAVERERARVRGLPAHLLERRADVVARRAVRHDEVRDLVVAGARGDRHAAVIAVPALVMNILAPSITHSPPSARARAGRAGVGAGLRLGQPEGRQPLAGGELRQPLARAAARRRKQDGHRAERGVRGDGDRERGVDARELLDGQGVGQRVGAGAAVVLGDGMPSRPSSPPAAARRAGSAGAVELLGDRGDLAFGELADGVAEQTVLVGEVEVHAPDDTA